MEKIENPIIIIIGTQKMIIKRPLKQTIKQRSICKNKSRHAIDEINRSVKSIVPKTEWSFTLS